MEQQYEGQYDGQYDGQYWELVALFGERQTMELIDNERGDNE